MKTRCPNCQTSFRITPEQLKARVGKVRCGQCQTVFNALDSLLDETITAAPSAPRPTQPLRPPVPPPAASAVQTVQMPDQPFAVPSTLPATAVAQGRRRDTR